VAELGECYLLEMVSGAEGSRTLDLLNAIRFPTVDARPQPTTTAEKTVTHDDVTARLRGTCGGLWSAEPVENP